MSEPIVIDAAAVKWTCPEADRSAPLLILLHGYGSDELDLFGLSAYLPSEYVVASVRAPLAPPFPGPGYSWYPIEGLDGRRGDDVTTAAEALWTWIDGLDWAGPIGILGFSQGAAVALQALRLRPEDVAFVVNLSGYAAPGELASDARLAEVRPPVFWGRGARDEVIPTHLVSQSVQWLPQHTELSGRVYAGLTHSVSQEELDDVTAFLRARLP